MTIMKIRTKLLTPWMKYQQSNVGANSFDDNFNYQTLDNK